MKKTTEEIERESLELISKAGDYFLKSQKASSKTEKRRLERIAEAHQRLANWKIKQLNAYGKHKQD